MEQELKKHIRSVLKTKKDIELKLEADAKIPNVDVSCHFMVLARLDGVLTGLRIAKRIHRKEQKICRQ